MSHSENTPNTATRSGVSALMVFAFVWIVFDNLALGIVAGLLVAGGIAARQRAGAKPGSQSPDGDGAA